ncbi:MAG TPA: glycosyltransferase family 2 protein [Gallionella sp.]|nr:glycosyltransferase family 2 protein [Gallionella sp.]
MLSIIIPVYRNEESIPDLVVALTDVARRARQNFNCATEVIFVVDGSPDNSYAILERALPAAPFASQLLLHSRYFGSFAAIRTGLQAATGDYFGVVAADLQEPPELVLQFMGKLSAENCDVVVGCRENRQDPLLSRSASNLFWKLYKKFVIREIPEKGVDVFGCNKAFRDQLVSLGEANTSLVGLIFWLGFKRSEVTYERRARQHGKSAWTLKKKFNYLLDSVFSFTDLPIRLLSLFGLLGVVASVLLGIVILLAKIFGNIPVPGYAATVLTVVFFGGLNSLGLGIVGAYAWRAFENTKNRPLAVVMALQKFAGVDTTN